MREVGDERRMSMTRRRRITRILSAIALVVAPACATSVADDPGFTTVDGGHDGGTDSTAADSGGTDTGSGGTDSGTTTSPVDTGTPPADTDPGGACTASCTADSDCNTACVTYGGTWCCDPGSSVCFQPSTGMCGGGGGGGDGGGADGGSD
jgi:hypothetical protein